LSEALPGASLVACRPVRGPDLDRLQPAEALGQREQGVALLEHDLLPTTHVRRRRLATLGKLDQPDQPRAELPPVRERAELPRPRRELARAPRIGAPRERSVEPRMPEAGPDAGQPPGNRPSRESAERGRQRDVGHEAPARWEVRSSASTVRLASSQRCAARRVAVAASSRRVSAAANRSWEGGGSVGHMAMAAAR
jgi:hypothetical protein